MASTTWIKVCSLDRLAAEKTVCTRVAGTDVVVICDADKIYALA
jgi:nitrite reductase/ring-hydroxylating ferredoxin subunit